MPLSGAPSRGQLQLHFVQFEKDLVHLEVLRGRYLSHTEADGQPGRLRDWVHRDDLPIRAFGAMRAIFFVVLSDEGVYLLRYDLLLAHQFV